MGYRVRPCLKNNKAWCMPAIPLVGRLRQRRAAIGGGHSGLGEVGADLGLVFHRHVSAINILQVWQVLKEPVTAYHPEIQWKTVSTGDKMS